MNPLHWFDYCFCISHPSTHREKAAKKHLRSVGLRPNFAYAAQPYPGFTVPNMNRNPRMEMACSLSHITAIVRALDYGCHRPLFVEDDVQIGDHSHLESALTSLPTDWAVVYLGGHPCEDVIEVSEHLVRVGRFSFAEAYCINGWCLGPFLEYWASRIGQPHAAFDRILGEFAAEYGGYCVVPTITRQPAGYSFIGEREDDKTHCVESGWANHLKR